MAKPAVVRCDGGHRARKKIRPTSFPAPRPLFSRPAPRRGAGGSVGHFRLALEAEERAGEVVGVEGDEIVDVLADADGVKG